MEDPQGFAIEYGPDLGAQSPFRPPPLAMSLPIYSVDDARRFARCRMPRIVFDYIDGAAGHETAAALNRQRLEEKRLQPRVLVNVDSRSLSKTLLGRTYALPFGIAPMGMCNLSWPGADLLLANAAVRHNLPLVLSTMSSTSLESVADVVGDNGWFQLYMGQSEEQAMALVDRAATAGYQTLVLTVDVPQVAPRLRDLRNGFKAPLRIGPKQFIDFALHPRWSLTTLKTGAPNLANFGEAGFDRDASRGAVDWGFLNRLRRRWRGSLVIKGVLDATDAVRIRDAGVEGIYISNHGGRQLDSAPAAIDRLPVIREAVGPDLLLLFDSGVRSGESIVKALASGADYVFLGRPFLYGLGADAGHGLEQVIEIVRNETSVCLAQLGCTDINEVHQGMLL